MQVQFVMVDLLYQCQHKVIQWRSWRWWNCNQQVIRGNVLEPPGTLNSTFQQEHLRGGSTGGGQGNCGPSGPLPANDHGPGGSGGGAGLCSPVPTGSGNTPPVTPLKEMNGGSVPKEVEVVVLWRWWLLEPDRMAVLDLVEVMEEHGQANTASVNGSPDGVNTRGGHGGSITGCPVDLIGGGPLGGGGVVQANPMDQVWSWKWFN